MRCGYRLLMVFVSCLVGAPTAVGDTYPRAAALDAIHYRLQLTLAANSDETRGRVTS